MTDDMPTPDELGQGFRIGDWEVLPARRVLRRGGQEIQPEPKVFGVLMSLARRGGDVVTRDELVDEVWEGRLTGDEPINRCISQLRKHLGDRRPYRYIHPVTGLGYQLREPVVPFAAAAAVPVVDSVPAKSGRLWPYMLAVAAIAAIAALWPSPQQPVDESISSIVVLPFDNAGGDPEDRYLTAGFRDEFVSTLKRIPEFTVKAGVDEQRDRSAAELGRLFAVDSVLRGNVQRRGEEIKVSYQLLRSTSGEVIAADDMTDDVRNLFELQERLARQVREQLSGTPQPQLVSASRPSNFDAYDTYLQGTYAFERRGNGRNLEDAMRLFQRTIDLDPGFGPAYLQLATATALLPSHRGADVATSNDRAIEIVKRGIAVDSSIEPAAGAVFGFVYHSRKEWAKAELAYEKATHAEVVDPNAFNWYSRMLASVGRLDAALTTALKAWEMAPDNAVINSRVALCYFWVGDAENAQAYFDRARFLGAEGATHLLGYALFLADQGRIAESRNVARVGAAQAGLPPDWIDAVLAGMEQAANSAAALESVDAAVRDGRLIPQVEVVARTLLGDIDGAMQVAEHLTDPGEVFEMDLLWIPQFRPLREHARFPQLTRDLGLAEYWELKGCRFEDTSVRCAAD